MILSQTRLPLQSQGMMKTSIQEPVHKAHVGFERICAFYFLLVLCLLTAGLMLFGSMRDVVLRFVHDDAFYYFGIARNWKQLGFSTFDGINPSNGYHPLWQWLLIGPAGWFLHVESFVRVFSAIGPFFLLAAAIMLKKTLNGLHNPYAEFAYYWVGGALILSTIYGLESPLVALIYAALIFSIPQMKTHLTLTRAAGCGLLAGLLFLARIDTLIWIVSLDFMALIMLLKLGWKRPAYMRLCFLFVLTQALIIGGYFCYNYLIWQHPLTVSAMTKSGRSPLFSLRIPKSLLFMLSLPITFAGCLILLDFAKQMLKSSDDTQLAKLSLPAWISLANLTYMAAILAKGGIETYNWYFVNVVLSGAIVLPFAIERYAAKLLLASPRWNFRLAMVLCALILVVNARGKLARSSSFVDAYDQAVQLATMPSNTLVFAATDCGILGSLSKQHCINLDGLTNSFAFQEALRDNRLAEWLKKAGLNAYIQSRNTPMTASVSLYAPPGIYKIGRRQSLLLEPWPDQQATQKLSTIRLFKIKEILP